MSKPGVGERDRRGGQLLEHILAGNPRARADDQAPQRRPVVVALEAALAHLAEGHQREHLAGCARGIRQRDVGEQVDVDDLAGEQLDGRVVAGDQSERDAARGELAEGRGSVSSPAFHRVGRSLKRERPPSGGLWSGNANTPPSAGGPPGGEVRGHAAETTTADAGGRRQSPSARSSISLPCLQPTVSYPTMMTVGEQRDHDERHPERCAQRHRDDRDGEERDAIRRTARGGTGRTASRSTA